MYYIYRSLDSRVVSHTDRAIESIGNSSNASKPSATSTPKDSFQKKETSVVTAIAPGGLSVQPAPLNIDGEVSAPTRLVARRDRNIELSPPLILEEPSFLINFSYHELQVRQQECYKCM